MKLFSQYKGLKKANYILFIGRIVTNMGAMIWPMLTLILNKKIGTNHSKRVLCVPIFMFSPVKNVCSGVILMEIVIR